MADENVDLENEETGKGKSKMLLFIILGALLLVALSVGVTFFVVSSMMPAPPKAEEAAQNEEPQEVEVPAVYVELEPEFIVSFQVGPRQRFLQVRVHVMTRKESIAEQLKFHNPALRNNIIQVLGQQDFNMLRTPEGRLQLQDEIKVAVVRTMKSEAQVDEGIEKVLLTDFVMQ